ncbi:hypothetical protein [Lentzea sp. CA-135723]|uniref:hypothetical protein n=1 Tax=Lentzea sp. CA-135723 TaxID=3239950 RepID=UPI003D8D02B3
MTQSLVEPTTARFARPGWPEVLALSGVMGLLAFAAAASAGPVMLALQLLFIAVLAVLVS